MSEPTDNVLSGVRQRIDEMERSIREDRAELAAVAIQQAKQREESLRWFESLSPGQQVELFRSDPEAYRQAMAAIASRNVKKLSKGGA